SMWSFGPIKTATALAGGVLCVRDEAVLQRMRMLETGYPVQTRGAYAKRVLYRAFVTACEALGKDHDRVIQGSVRGFAGGEFYAKIRKQPSAPLFALLDRRLEHADGSRVKKRTSIAE